MKTSRIIAIAKKQFTTLLHDRRTLGLMIIAPIMSMLIFGFAFGKGVSHVPILLMNQDKGSLSTKIINTLDTNTLDIQKTSDENFAKDEVTKGDKVAVIVFPQSFSTNASPTIQVTPIKNGSPLELQQKVIPPKGTSIQIFIDTTNEQMATAVLAEVGSSLQKAIEDQGVKSPITLSTDYAFPLAKDATYMDSFVPGIMAFAITLFTTLLTLLAFVSERTSGTLNRLRVTPVTETEIVLGYELAFGIIAAIQGALLLLVALVVYHVLVVGSLLLAVLIVILTAIDAQAIGIVISAAAKRESQAVQFLPFIIFPAFLLSGIFVPLPSLPSWLQPFSYIIPPTWGIMGLRDVLLKGWGIEQVWMPIIVLVGFAVLFTILAIFGLKRSKT